MKKIILILFLFLSCYLIYTYTEDNTLSYLVIGDTIADNPYIKNNPQIKKYNNSYISNDFRITDLINVIKYNEETNINNKKISIHRLLKNSDVIIISIGMNDIYYKLNSDTKDIYTYLNDIIEKMEILLSEINRYHYTQVLVLGYYNITNNNNDIFTYLNYKLKKTIEKYRYEYIELNDTLKNSPHLYKKANHFTLNSQGYNEINKIIVEKLKKY